MKNFVLLIIIMLFLNLYKMTTCYKHDIFSTSREVCEEKVKKVMERTLQTIMLDDILIEIKEESNQDYKDKMLLILIIQLINCSDNDNKIMGIIKK
ncbi:MAG: hypothetical protein KatS3mg129_2309 [Leptospiraceae bacterium]|nr:MAG: hypothetical protein KatS3mg129_2309 [Leptospiraceae bacterium]